MANERKRYTHSRNASSASTYSGGSIRDHKRWSGVSIITGHPLSPRPRTPNLVDPLNSSSAAPDTIHKQLRLLRLDEIVSLAQDPRALRIIRQNDSLLRTVTTPIWSYYKFLWTAASNVIMTSVQYDLSPRDWVQYMFVTCAMVLFSFFGFFWSFLAVIPRFNLLYEDLANKYAHGLGVVTTTSPDLFNSLTADEVSAAKRGLSEGIEKTQEDEHSHTFDLDIAKFLLQFASIVNEREHGTIFDTVRAIAASSTTSSTPIMSAAAASSTRAKPRATTTPFSGIIAPAGRLVRQVYTPERARSIENTYANTFSARNTRDYGFGSVEREESRDRKGQGDAAISVFCYRLEVEYEPVSELGCVSSAFCSFFWDARQNWIVVTFKGTSPTEYNDWIEDCTTSLAGIDDFLPGYGKVIKSIKDRLYPTTVSDFGGTRPWDTIRFALRKLAGELSINAAALGSDGKVNVWFTGHSLGCPLASLAYARAINSPTDFAGTNIEIRDAYLFGAPVVGDRDCLLAFNARMRANGKSPKTLWRVTNHWDAVTTLLSDYGDRVDLNLSPNNPAGLAHLGAEIRMSEASNIVNGSGGAFLEGSGTFVRVRSAFTKEDLAATRERVMTREGETAREQFGRWAVGLPGLGRFIAHGTLLYWDQLDRMSLGECRWAT